MSDHADQVSATRTVLTPAGLGAVYGAEIPEELIGHQPIDCVLVVWAGGPQMLAGGYRNAGDVRLDLRFYGASQPANIRRAWAAHQVLKHFRQQVVDGLLLHWYRPAGGPVPRRDTDLGWRFIQTSWQLLSADPTPEPS